MNAFNFLAPHAVIRSALAGMVSLGLLAGCGQSDTSQKTSASSGPAALAVKSGCMACHAADKKLVGPAFQDVARKYQASDEAALIQKVRNGGKGSWGQIPMPPNPNLKDEDAKALVQWILAGAK